MTQNPIDRHRVMQERMRIITDAYLNCKIDKPEYLRRVSAVLDDYNTTTLVVSLLQEAA